ncbi:FAD-dependent monooxygenase [bacterium]|nr:FAD-dependent monooxygenase [bacterium]
MARNEKRKTEVLIVGAGPVGLMTAVCLAERGVKVAIVDRERRTNVHSYALVLHPRSLDLLEEAGVVNELIPVGYRVDRLGVYDNDVHRATLNFSKLQNAYPFALSIPQSRLETILERRLADLGVKVLWNHEVETIEQTGDGVEASIDHIEEIPKGYPIMQMHRVVTSTSTFHADYVVGTDGYNSLTRKLLQIEYQDLNEAQVFSVYEFHTDMNLDNEVRLTLSQDTVNVLWPMKDGRCRWSFELKPGESHNHSNNALSHFIEERAPWFTSRPEHVEWSARVRFEHRLVTQFGRDRVWLAGDSGHLTSPVGCQSMNVGLIEGHDLACRLFEILRNNGSEESLSEYNANCTEMWKRLLMRDGDPQPSEGANEWTAGQGRRLLPCIPAATRQLEVLMDQIGLQF